jgi:predicted transcriptional regulator of viral defense system
VLSRHTFLATIRLMTGVGRIATACLTQSTQPPPVDVAIGERAARQHGVVSLEQLVADGLTASAVRMRVASGRLWRVHRGVYAVGHRALAWRGAVMAAVLACGEGAATSYRTAGALRGLRPDNRTRIDVSSPGRRGRAIAGIDAHRGHTLRSGVDVEIVDGIPCTSLARTLLDLAEVVDRRQVERACEQADVLQLFDLRAIEEVLEHAGAGRRGAALLRAVLADLAEATPTRTRSKLEERFLALCRGAGLPAPEVNAWIALQHGAGVEADFLWRAQRLIVETDGRDVHMTRASFESDRVRDGRLLVAGWRVLRVTGLRLRHEPDEVVQMIRALL